MQQGGEDFTTRIRPIACAAIFDLPHPNRPFKPQFQGRLSAVDLNDIGTRSWPRAVTRDCPLSGNEKLAGYPNMFRHAENLRSWLQERRH